MKHQLIILTILLLTTAFCFKIPQELAKHLKKNKAFQENVPKTTKDEEEPETCKLRQKSSQKLLTKTDEIEADLGFKMALDNENLELSQIFDVIQQGQTGEFSFKIDEQSLYASETIPYMSYDFQKAESQWQIQAQNSDMGNKFLSKESQNSENQDYKIYNPQFSKYLCGVQLLDTADIDECLWNQVILKDTNEKSSD